MSRVLMFEDDDENYAKLARALSEGASKLGASLERYPGDKSWDAIKATPLSKTVVASLVQPEPARLVIVDWDLTKYGHPVTPELVMGLCDELGLPSCVYQTEYGPIDQVKRMQHWQDAQISIDSFLRHEEIARRCLSILDGFIRIWAEFSNRGNRDLRDVIRALLQPPRSAEVNLDQYAWGQPKTLQVAERGENKLRFASTATGYWIYNRLLQFPGILLNAAAAASYLDIDHEVFLADERLRAVFDKAGYKGPFCEIEPFWWSSGLDEIRAERTQADDKALKSGFEVAREAGFNVGHAKCLRGHEGAGYYCIITRAPVCADHSVPPGGWLPLGADRSRIEKRKFDELSAWLAI